MASERIPSNQQPVIHRFDYATTKATFMQEVEYVILDKKLQNKVLQRKEDVINVINDLKHFRIHFKKYYIVRCHVVEENGKDILCQVTTRFNGKSYYVMKIKQILSIDELFDILCELHMLKPYLDEARIAKYLGSCSINEAFINLFRKSCGTCCIPKNNDMYYRVIGEMTILKMPSPDGNFNVIFLYVERNTNFVLLRPLESATNQELAYELLTIFTDFGSPTYLDSDKAFKEAVKHNEVLMILKLLDPPFRIPTLYASSRNHKLTVTARIANKMLLEWMENTGSTNWAIGAHIVQWQMNINKVVDTYVRSRVVSGVIYSPYHALFGTLPHSNLIKITQKRLSSAVSKEKVLVDCSQCNLPVYKLYKCQFCKRICHFSCCDRYVEHSPDGAIFINKCFSCTNIDMCVDEEIILGC